MAIIQSSLSKPYFCKEASYLEGKHLYVSGIAVANTESKARKISYYNSKKEVERFYNGDLNIKYFPTVRTHTEKIGKKYYVCRLVRIDINKNVKNKNKVGFGILVDSIAGHSFTNLKLSYEYNYKFSGIRIGVESGKNEDEREVLEKDTIFLSIPVYYDKIFLDINGGITKLTSENIFFKDEFTGLSAGYRYNENGFSFKLGFDYKKYTKYHTKGVLIGVQIDF